MHTLYHISKVKFETEIVSLHLTRYKLIVNNLC